MTKSELNEAIKKELSSCTFDSKKYFEIRALALERCKDYYSKQSDKSKPGYSDRIDFQLETLYYSAIEESVNATINVLVQLGVLLIDD